MKRYFLLLVILIVSRGEAALTPRANSPFSTTISPTGFTVLNVQFAMDNAGNVVAAWSVNNRSNVVVQAAFKPVGGPWQLPGVPTQQENIITPLRFTATNFQLAGDDQGNAVIVWQVFNGRNVVIQAAYKPFGAPWQTPGSPIFQSNVLSFFGFNVSVPPTVAIANANVLIAWQIFNDTNTVAQASFRPNAIGSRFSQPGTPRNQDNVLSPFRFNITSQPAADVDNDGNCVVAWEIFNRSNTVIQAVLKNGGLPFQIAEDPRNQANILSPLRFNSVNGPQVNIESGNVVVLWTLFDGLTTVLQASYKTPLTPFQ